MQMAGEITVAADRWHVWNALNDPDVLRQCIPGCETVIRETDNSLMAKIVAKVGPIKANFSGKVTLSELDPPNSYVISGEGSGGAAGFAKGSAAVKLTAVSGGTQLSYEVDSAVGGKLAQIGARLIDSTARKMAEDFFDKFVQIAEKTAVTDAGPVPAPTAATSTPASIPTTAEASAAAPKTRHIFAALIVLIIGAALYFLR